MAPFMGKQAVLGLLGVVAVSLIVTGITIPMGLITKNKDSVQAGTASLALAITPVSPPVLEPVMATPVSPSAQSLTTTANIGEIVPAVGLSIVKSEIASQQSGTLAKSVSGKTIEFNRGKLCNNQWGAPLEENLNCSIYLSQNNTFGWYWDRTNPLVKSGMNGVLPIYPSVRVGGNPWEKSNSVLFPVKVMNVNSLMLNLNYKYATIPDGSYDFAYDLFLTDTDQPCSTPVRKAEVMIWIHQSSLPPGGSYKGDFSDGINTYELYSYVMADGRLYFAFVMKGQPLYNAQYKIDAKKLLDYLNLNPNWYIPGIELGNEIINGSGNLEITQFDVILNGHSS
jgi:hypothetical protein